MSTHRIRPDAGWQYSTKEKGPNGRGLCRMCGDEVSKGRRTFCSERCVYRWKMQTDPGHVRHEVWKRDKGVCAKCKLDTETLKAGASGRWTRTKEEQDRLASMGFPPRALYAGDYWQADHIIEVVMGGGGCGLDNYQTLCTPCHKRKTAELRARLKERRRSARIAAMFGLTPPEPATIDR